MEPLCTDTQAMMPCLPAQESNSISLKRHAHSSGVLTGLTRGPNWPKPLPPSPHLTNSKPSGAITKMYSAHLMQAGVQALLSQGEQKKAWRETVAN